MPLPPGILGIIRPEGSEGVIGVHAHMNEGIDEAVEGSVATRDKPDTDPGGNGHDGVVEHVERAHVLKLFAGDKRKLERVKIGHESLCTWDY